MLRIVFFTALASAVVLDACSSPEVVTERGRLENFRRDCGFSISLPMMRDDLLTMIESNRGRSYTLLMPSDGSSGDGVFPLESNPERTHGPIQGAVVVVCEGEDARVLGARSPRYAYYFDELGVVFHVEEKTLRTG